MQTSTNTQPHHIQTPHKTILNKSPQNPQPTLKQLTLKIHDLYYKQIKFKQIDYIAGQAPPGMLPQIGKQQFGDFLVLIDGCLVFMEKFYDKMYYFLLKTVIDMDEDWEFRNMAGDILISMNGQNEKVYNLKKTALKHMINALTKDSSVEIKQNQQKLDLERQLNLNAAIRMKFKKSSACYEYRIRLMEYKFKVHNLYQDNISLSKLHKTEHELIVKILERFPRNYFCWMYRLRLFKQFISVTKNKQIFENQLKMVLNLLNKHPNDYSIYSYLRFLLRISSTLESYKQLVQITGNKCRQLLQFCKMAYESEQQYKRLIEFANEVKKSQHKQESA